jgi:DNA replication protein DnaC
MERLNEIMGRAAQRRQYAEQRASQGAGSSPRIPPSRSDTQHLTPEQMARLGQRNLYGAPNRRFEVQSAQSSQISSSRLPQEQEGTNAIDRQENPLYGGYPASRAPRLRTVMNSTVVPYQQSPARPCQDDAYATPSRLSRSGSRSYPSDEYLPPPQPDVAEQWEEDGGMVYGDWEGDDEETVIYQRDEYDVIPEPESRPSYYVEPETPSIRDIEARTHITRDLRVSPTSYTPPALPQRSSQDVTRSQRITQPLNSQALARLNHEREHFQGSLTRRTRQQQAPREPVTPVPVRATPPISQDRNVCPKCKGAGFLRADVPFGHPNFGKPVPCECKESERKDRRRQQLREMSNLDAFRNHSFKTFNPRVPGVQEAYQVCLEYAQSPDGWLLLIGPNGCGKTHLAAAIANACLDDGSVVLFSVVPDLLDHLRAAFAPTASEVYDQLFAKMREAEVLVLDDLGAQQSSPWASEKLFQLLNYRYNMGMPTVITANPKGIQGIDERIRSRLSDTSLVTVLTFDRARDYRPNHPRHTK